MKINWKVRLSNPHFYAQVILAVLLPILAYMGLTLEDLSTWSQLGQVLVDAALNPYVFGTVVVSVYNAVVDPTTHGLGDSKQALGYSKPRKDEK